MERILDGKYEIGRLLGTGGWGVVYAATQLKTGQEVAVKFLHTSDHEDPRARSRRVERFKREMEICGQLHHPDVVRLVDYGDTSEQIYIVFELIPGRTLADLLREEGALPVSSALSLMTQLLDVLDYAHRSGLVHRDLKPSNLMVVSEGPRPRLKVLDFGVSAFRERDPQDYARLTLSDEVIGTPAYAAPEQLRGDSPTVKVDMYAWGLILLECITGRCPIEGSSVAEVFQAQLASTPVPMPEILQAHALGSVLAWVLQKDDARRCGSASDVRQRIEALAVESLIDASGYFVDLAWPGRPSRSPAAMRTLARLPPLEERHPAVIVAVRIVVTPRLAPRTGVQPEVVDRELTEIWRSVSDATSQYGGVALGGAGEVALFAFGLPQVKDADARMAMRAALEVCEGVRARSESALERAFEAGVRVGIHAGSIPRTAGASIPFVAHGMTAATALALASSESGAGKSGAAVVVSEEFRRLVARHADFEDVPESCALPWLEERLPVVRLRSESRSGAFGFEGTMVGRDEELAQLLAAWRTPLGAPQRRAELICGDAGIGKSRLVAEFRQAVVERGGGCIELLFAPERQGIALGAILELVLELLGMTSRNAATAEAIEDALRTFAIDPRLAVSLLCSWLAIPHGHEPVSLSPGKQRRMLLNILSDIVLEAAQRRRAFLLVEDLHWSDPSSLEWLGGLLERAESRGMLVVFTSRPRTQWPRWVEDVHEIQLKGLARGSALQLVAQHVQGAPLPHVILEELLARSDGTPLFLEELTRSALERSSELEGGAGAPLPSTLRALLSSRIDRLGAAKKAAQVAAAIGREFDHDLLSTVLDQDEGTLRADLEQLLSAGLVVKQRRIDGNVYLFRHVLIRDAALELLSQGARQAIHRAIAEALVNDFPERALGRPELVAHHLHEGGEFVLAYPRWLEAAEVSMRASSYEEALAHIGWGLEAVRSLTIVRPEAELALLQRKAACLFAKHGTTTNPLLDATFERMTALLDQDGVPARPAFFAQHALWNYQHIRPDQQNAHRLAQTLEEAAVSTDDALLKVGAAEAMCRTAFFRGEFEVAHQRYATCHRYYPQVASSEEMRVMFGGDPLVNGMCFGALSALLCGRVDEAVAAYEEAIAFTRSLGRKGLTAGVLATFGAMFVFRNVETGGLAGDAALIDERLRESRELAEAYGHPGWEAMARTWALILDYARGKPRPIEDVLQALDIFFAPDQERLGASMLVVYLVRILGESGRVNEGLAVIERLEAYGGRSGEAFMDAERLRVHADLLTRRGAAGDREAALRVLAEATATARSQSARLFELRATLDQWDRLAGTPDAAAVLSSLGTLAESWRAHGEGRDLPSVQRLFEVLERPGEALAGVVGHPGGPAMPR